MVQVIPPPPFIAGKDLQPLNRWLLEIQSILSSEGTTFVNGATAVTQPPGDNSDLIATDAFVLANAGGVPSTTNPLMDGVASPGVSLEYSRGDHVHPTDTSRAPTVSPAFTGTPTAPTAGPLTDDTQVATTAYADAAVAVETSRAETAEALLAPLASPGLTGVPTGPTAANGTNTTQLATTQFVQSAVAGGGGSAPVVKAAVNFAVSGGVVTIFKSFNVTSVTRTGTGQYVIDFTTAMADALYYMSVTADDHVSGGVWGMCNGGTSGASKTATQGPVAFFSNSSTVVDPVVAYVLIFE